MTNSETYLKVGHFRASKSRQVPQDYVLDIWGEQTMAIHMIFFLKVWLVIWMATSCTK